MTQSNVQSSGQFMHADIHRLAGNVTPAETWQMPKSSTKSRNFVSPMMKGS